MPAIIPIRHAVEGDTYPAAGVIVASPATAPVKSPRNLGFFPVNQSTASHATAANDAARSVLRNATAVTESTRNSLPALNPYHPNHKSPVPSATSGMLCSPLSSTFRLPTNKTDASRRDPRDIVHHDPARKVLHAPLRQNPPAPHHVHKGEVHEQQPPRQEQHVRLERHPIRERPRDQLAA